MAFTADTILDRRRLRRSLTRWRVLAFLALMVAVGVGAYALTLPGGPAAGGEHIARVSIAGFIAGDRSTLSMIEDIGKSRASAVILSIDSPGGTASGAEALHDAIRVLAAKKPVVAVVNNIAASGGYIVAIAADRIYARQNSFVGSIGVIIQYPDVTRLLDTVGVKVEEIKSSPLKASPNGLTPAPEEAREALRALIADSYEWFRNLVRSRRGYDDAGLAAVSDGRVFTGRQAAANRLIDAIGNETDAIAWLVAARGVPKDLSVRDWKPRSDSSFRFWSVGAGAARGLGLERLARLLDGAGLAADAAATGGLLALWRPSMEQ